MLNLAILSFFAGASADTCQNIAGNYYCDQTSLVQFNNVGFSGSYNRVTSFNDDGSCSSTPQSFSGSLSPFDEELSIHFRGPIQLEHLRVFSKQGGSSPQKRHVLHHRHAEPEPVIVTATDYYTNYVTVGAGGPSESVITSTATAPASSPATSTTSPEWSAPSSSSAASPSSSSSVSVYNYNYNHLDQTSQTGPSVITRTTSSESAQLPSSTGSSGSGGWSKIASYDAAAGSANGLVFLNNLGGSGSGVFDFKWGNSLSYCGSDGKSAASSPQVLSRTTVPSNTEFIVFTDNECQGNSCGYYRPGTVPYHGFSGTYKAFVFEFSMPSDGGSGFNADMPAVWLLNAQIPRTLQYGEKSCSCWSSGCGELDLFEILNGGNNRLTTTLHDNQNGGGGTANWFQRPTQGTLKAAAIFDGSTISVLEIPEIPDSLDDSTIESWIKQAGNPSSVNI